MCRCLCEKFGRIDLQVVLLKGAQILLCLNVGIETLPLIESDCSIGVAVQLSERAVIRNHRLG